MCYHFQITLSAQKLEHRFKAKFENASAFHPEVYNGFQHPKTPVITNLKKDVIQLYDWGLIPHWAKDKSIQSKTLNARIETIHEKAFFRDIVHNRCLVLADGFYEWKWLDSKGRNKQKYFISLPNQEAFAFAGLFSHWTDQSTGEVLQTYTILTTDANELMREIHNSKKRMPIILNRHDEQDWLAGENNILKDIELVAGEV